MTKEKTKLSVVQSNHLIEASYRMDIRAKRVMLCLLAQINSRQASFPEKVHLDVNQYIQWTDATEKNNAYRDMKEGAKALLTTIIRTYDYEAKAGEMTVLADYLKYFDGEARIECSFSQWIRPYIHFLSKNFTQMKLADVAHFTSFYSIRLYEILMQYKSEGIRHITVEKYRLGMGLTEGQYPAYSDLRRRTIDPAVKEINEKSAYEVDYIAKKKGKATNSLTFTFKEKQQIDMFE